ncbi:NYN domain-containing protein [Trichocoleus sp. FACHB-262]|uniref:NYN domain-containing protein n=1 Tax=Trichocoleus sp. FACHB-262 TaxID=2692869 RepID=UPI001689CF56|nr:NYN domain-containing protein [Trichocoleus sp. FACHB-262]MBD2123646.1 NYN domain-containing protein [Trichocoleus sp. FACHB-262]
MPRSLLQAVLLVDGYNVVGTWPELKQARDCDGLEAARWKLIEALTNYSAFQGYDTQVVFDAQYRDTASNCEIVTQNLSVHYTDFGQTADTFIERACALFRHDIRKFHSRLIVATSDRAQQLTVVGYGAEWMSSQQLAFEVETAAHRIHRKQRNTQRSPQRFLANSLDPAAQQRLAELRMGVKPKKFRKY